MSNDKAEAAYYPEAPKVPNREQIAAQLGVDVEDIPDSQEQLTNQTPPPAPPPHAHMDEH